jgi:Flp pilus assembly pilin Flp
MRRCRQALARWLKRDEGATSVEYAVLLFLIAAICMTAIQFLGNNSSQTFSKAGVAVSTPVPGGPGPGPGPGAP